MDYYVISCKFGHSGSGRYRVINLSIAANNINDAIYQAKRMPGVKHNSNSVIIGLKKLTKEQYIENRKISAYEQFKKESE